MSDKRIVPIRINAWLFAGLAVAVVAIVAFVAGFERVELLVGLAGVVAGGLVATIERLCAPEPAEPAPQPVMVPVEVVQPLIEVLGELVRHEARTPDRIKRNLDSAAARAEPAPVG